MRRPSQEGQAHVRSPINPAGVAHYNGSASRLCRPQPARASRAGGPPCSRACCPVPPAASDMSSPSAACAEVAGRHSPQQGDNVPIKAVSCQPPTSTPCPARAGPPHSGPCHPPVPVGVPTGVACPLPQLPQEVQARQGNWGNGLIARQPLGTVLPPGRLASSLRDLGQVPGSPELPAPHL